MKVQIEKADYQIKGEVQTYAGKRPGFVTPWFVVAGEKRFGPYHPKHVAERVRIVVQFGVNIDGMALNEVLEIAMSLTSGYHKTGTVARELEQAGHDIQNMTAEGIGAAWVTLKYKTKPAQAKVKATKQNGEVYYIYKGATFNLAMAEATAKDCNKQWPEIKFEVEPVVTPAP